MGNAYEQSLCTIETQARIDKPVFSLYSNIVQFEPHVPFSPQNMSNWPYFCYHMTLLHNPRQNWFDQQISS